MISKYIITKGHNSENNENGDSVLVLCISSDNP